MATDFSGFVFWAPDFTHTPAPQTGFSEKELLLLPPSLHCLFQRPSTQVPTSPLTKLCVVFYSGGNFSTGKPCSESPCIFPNEQCLWLKENVSAEEKKREKKNWGEGNKAVPLIIWKPWQSQAGCNNLCEPSALSTAVSSLLPAPTFCCFPPGSHHVIPKPSREITEEKPLERQQATTLTWSRVITLIKILVELVNRNKWLAKK